jgi:protein-disulfide isomerase
MHPHALKAAEAAEAAGAQGKFWNMHDKLFINQHNLSVPALLTYASDLELDVPRFAAELQEDRYLSKLRRDFMEGVRSGVNGTPTFFINGERWNGSYDAESLLAGIQGQMGADLEPMTGLPWEGERVPRVDRSRRHHHGI